VSRVSCGAAESAVERGERERVAQSEEEKRDAREAADSNRSTSLLCTPLISFRRVINYRSGSLLNRSLEKWLRISCIERE